MGAGGGGGGVAVGGCAVADGAGVCVAGTGGIRRGPETGRSGRPTTTMASACSRPGRSGSWLVWAGASPGASPGIAGGARPAGCRSGGAGACDWRTASTARPRPAPMIAMAGAGDAGGNAPPGAPPAGAPRPGLVEGYGSARIRHGVEIRACQSCHLGSAISLVAPESGMPEDGGGRPRRGRWRTNPSPLGVEVVRASPEGGAARPPACRGWRSGRRR